MSLIKKYNLSEEDLEQLFVIESKKTTAGIFEKEKLKAASLKILKPYKVKFMDLGNLLSEIKNGGIVSETSKNIPETEKQETEKIIQEKSSVTSTNKSSSNGKMAKILSFGAVLLVFLFFFKGCGRTEPEGFFYGGKWDDPDEFYFEFKEGGKISICRGYLYERNCCADGSWQMSGNSIVISGISNGNCPEMTSLNGTYSACDKPDCMPSGKAFKKGDITIWPDKK